MKATHIRQTKVSLLTEVIPPLILRINMNVLLGYIYNNNNLYETQRDGL